MATYHHSIKSGKKGTAASHAAYIARQGKYRAREDLVLTGHGNLPDWAQDKPSKFWKAGDKYERANGAVYREHEIALPRELSLAHLQELIPKLVITFAGDKPHHYALHTPCSSIEGHMNPHLHLMISDRIPDGITRSPEQTFSRFNAKRPEQGGCRKDSGGKSPGELREAVIKTRETSASLLNAALKGSGSGARVDHRSLRDQGIARQRERHLGPTRVQSMSAQDKANLIQSRMDAS